MLQFESMQANPHEIDQLNQKAYTSIYNNISLASALVKEARELSSEVSYTGGIAWSLLIEGLLHIEQGKLDQAEGKLYEAHHIFIELNNDMKGK